MPQSRVRKAPGGGGSDAGKTRASAAKASGDNAPSGRTKEHNQNNSKNKIPKKIQYDLDNALVGLCDVWFEEIKPHLLRNNIKLHVEGAGPAGGDHHCLPAEAPGCSHDDPASTANECELCRLLFNAANSIESAVSQAASAASSTGLASAASELASNASHTRSDVSGRWTDSYLSINKPTTRQTPKHRHSRKGQISPKEYQNRRTPHLSRTNAVQTPDSPHTIIRKIDHFLSSTKSREDHYVPNNNQRIHVETQDEYSQTVPVPILCQNSLLIKRNAHKKYRLNTKESKLTFTVGDSLNRIALQDTFATHKSFAQKHRPTVPPMRYNPPQSTISKSQVLPGRAQSRTISTEDKSKRSTSLEKRSLFSGNRPLKTRWPIHSEDRLMSEKDRSIVQKNFAIQRDRNIPPQHKPSKPRRRKLTQNQTPAPKVRCPSPETVTRPGNPPLRPTPSQELHTLKGVKPMVSAVKPVCPQMYFLPTSKKQEILIRDKRQKANSYDRNKEINPLFDRDLIDIIAEKNDRRVRVLFQNPDRIESCSTALNLYSPKERRRKTSFEKPRLLKPWR